MTNDLIRAQIDDVGIIPAIRMATGQEAMYAAETIALGGIPIVELTMTIPGVLDVIKRLRLEHPGIVVGAGTVLDMPTAKRCVDAGAMFLTSPGLVTEIVEFGVAQVGGPGYIRALKRPFPEALLIASGGVNQQTAGDFILAGATALGIGEQLIPHRAVHDRKSDWIHELARRFNVMVKHAREKRMALEETAAAEHGD